ncbi:GPW/gp25 family protein [Endozoicomonas gorgoniicola]|uniref:GPW/gp25 family protein n=1 Tax=Endozoicomonas gorgoniicola TaxID=1234144 RepID=A0ABT3N0W7_9GAMM|nr:GPW/gp25 family protein [Endozoicomonas gorgoniicola]MCW7555262.1 GPW/gp25 family protein [Endozoicomonas gorgoniicola]
MLNQSLPAFIVAVLSGYCGASPVTSGSHQPVDPFNPCDPVHYDTVIEASPGDDLLVHLESIRRSLPRRSLPKTPSADFGLPDSSFYFEPETNRRTEQHYRFERRIKKMLSQFKTTKNDIIPLNSDDEDSIFSGSGSGSGGIQDYSGTGSLGGTRLPIALLLLKASKVPYEMKDSMDISDFSLTICSLGQSHQNGIMPGIESDKPATVKLAPALSVTGSDSADAKSQKAWFSVTGKAGLSIFGVFLNAFESEGNFPLIYAEGKSIIIIGWSDIIRTTSKPKNILNSNRSMMVVERGTLVPRIHIAHSRLYSNLHKGSIIKSKAVPNSIPSIRKNKIFISVSNSYLYVPKGDSAFDTGALTTLIRTSVNNYFSSTPDHYKYFVQMNSDNPLKLLNNHDAYSDNIDMTGYISSTSSEMSGHSSFTQSYSSARTSSARTVTAWIIPLILPFAFALF